MKIFRTKLPKFWGGAENFVHRKILSAEIFVLRYFPIRWIVNWNIKCVLWVCFMKKKRSGIKRMRELKMRGMRELGSREAWSQSSEEVWREGGHELWIILWNVKFNFWSIFHTLLMLAFCKTKQFCWHFICKYYLYE